MSHIGLYVTDMTQSVSFYTKVLGLKILEDCGVGSSGKAITFLGYDRPVLELISSVTDPDLNKRPARGPFDHMAWYVDDIKSEVDRIKGLGVTFSPDQIMTVLDGRKIAFFHGPDGERMELVQRV